ncbi:BglG family transcription antiterminator [Bacillus sp. B1-b2]|uniref:BglG family transcription antiterminator n=1 Tax=Bacillus sp. B1-b2 TaxID=2653201 RepID=UPI001261B82B|nr:PTS sugar transporter subunit IIA [Bacillus sp. B1-b2]KAB7668381.1 BglG family transcription antiterminator [Bacillus sp. B1-b2]
MKERTKLVLKRFLTANTYLTFQDLSEEFHISERTLRNELGLINDYLSNNSYPLVSTKRGIGMKLPIPIHDGEHLLAQLNGEKERDYFLPEERFLALILNIAESSKVTLLYEMEEVLQVSKSTLDDDMRKLRQYLDKYAVNVVSLTKQGIVFQGEERSIRSMLFDVINSMTVMENLMSGKDQISELSYSERMVVNYLGEETIRRLHELYEEHLKNFRPDMNDVYRNQLTLLLAVWVKRVRDGNTVSEVAKIRRELNEGEVRHYIDEVCKAIDLYPSLNEIKYITFTVEAFHSKDMNNSLDWVSAQLLTIQLIAHVEKKTGIPFSLEEEDLYEGLYRHIIGLLSRAKHQVKAFNPLKNTIRDSYPAIYQAVASFSRHIEEYTKKTLSNDEVAFLTIYFSTSTSRMKQDEQYVYQAVVVCNHGISTGRLLAANLKEQFNIEIVAVLSSYELNFIGKLDVDLIFTTIPIEQQRKPMLLLNPILRDSDKKENKAFLKENETKRRIVSSELDATKLLQDILSLMGTSNGKVTKESYLSLVNTFKEHRLKINTREIQPMLQDVLKDTNILLHQHCKDWKEVIRRVASPLVSEGSIGENYVQAMIKSVEEYGPYIVIGKNLALAHARPEDGVHKLGVSVMTLKEPVHFGNEENDPVKIVFCLAAVDSYSHLNIMRSLVELINDGDKVNKLLRLEDLKAFKKELLNIE